MTDPLFQPRAYLLISRFGQLQDRRWTRARSALLNQRPDRVTFHHRPDDMYAQIAYRTASAPGVRLGWLLPPARLAFTRA